MRYPLSASMQPRGAIAEPAIPLRWMCSMGGTGLIASPQAQEFREFPICARSIARERRAEELALDAAYGRFARPTQREFPVRREYVARRREQLDFRQRSARFQEIHRG